MKYEKVQLLAEIKISKNFKRVINFFKTVPIYKM